MDESTEEPEGRPTPSEHLFAEWLSRGAHREALDALLSSHPALAGELRELHDVWKRCRILFEDLARGAIPRAFGSGLPDGEARRLQRLVSSLRALGKGNGG